MNLRNCPSSLQIEVRTQVFTRHAQRLSLQEPRAPQQNLIVLIIKFSSISLFPREECVLVTVALPPSLWPWL